MVQMARALFLRCPPETGECALSRSNSASRIFLVSQHDAADHLPVGRLDDVHDLAAMGFNECSIDVVRRDRFNLLALHDCFHRVFSLCENLSQNEVTATRVRELLRQQCKRSSRAISGHCAKSLHSWHLLRERICLCVTWNRHCPFADSSAGLCMALYPRPSRTRLSRGAFTHG